MTGKNLEIEIKVLDIDPAEISARLQKQGAVLKFRGLLRARYFDTATQTLFKQGRVLRLRKVNDHTELTYKGRTLPGSCKIREELQVLTDDFEQSTQILNALGFKLISYQEKKRISFKWQALRVDIDQYPGIPAFLELEGPTEASIKAGIKLLGLSQNPKSQLSMAEFFEKFYPKVDYRNLKF